MYRKLTGNVFEQEHFVKVPRQRFEEVYGSIDLYDEIVGLDFPYDISGIVTGKHYTVKDIDDDFVYLEVVE
jgi:hypothetical protein